MSQLLAFAESMVETLSNEYIKELKKDVKKHDEQLESVKDIEMEDKDKLIKYLKDRQEIFKLLVLLWNQITSETPNTELVKKMLERYDDKACAFFEYLNDLTLQELVGENDYLYDCDFFKTQRDRVKNLLKIKNII